MKPFLLFAFVLLTGCVSTHHGAATIPGYTTTVTTFNGARFYWHDPVDATERAKIDQALREIDAAVQTR